MSLESYASLAEIIGVTLVVPSLIYVAIQLRQNTNAVRAQSRQAVLTASQAELFVQIERPEISLSIINPSVLTQEEQVRLSSFFSLFFVPANSRGFSMKMASLTMRSGTRKLR